MCEGCVIDFVGQPVEAGDFGLGDFTGFGQGRDQATFDPGAVAFGWPVARFAGKLGGIHSFDPICTNPAQHNALLQLIRPND